MASDIRSYRDLEAWLSAMDLVEATYRLTASFPSHEQFGLTLQIRKASVSIPSNVAEGNRRRQPAYLYHVEIALGSHAELETQMEIAKRLRYVSDGELEEFSAVSASVGRLLHGLLRSLS